MVSGTTSAQALLSELISQISGSEAYASDPDPLAEPSVPEDARGWHYNCWLQCLAGPLF